MPLESTQCLWQKNKQEPQQAALGAKHRNTHYQRQYTLILVNQSTLQASQTYKRNPQKQRALQPPPQTRHSSCHKHRCVRLYCVCRLPVLAAKQYFVSTWQGHTLLCARLLPHQDKERQTNTTVQGPWLTGANDKCGFEPSQATDSAL
jgi:hypothetical protein